MSKIKVAVLFGGVSSEHEVSKMCIRDRLYEEMINFYHKIDHYCETGEYTGALFAAVELTQEFDEAFLGTEVSSKELPDIVEIFDQQNIEPFLQAVKTHHQIDVYKRQEFQSSSSNSRQISFFDDIRFMNTCISIVNLILHWLTNKDVPAHVSFPKYGLSLIHI